MNGVNLFHDFADGFSEEGGWDVLDFHVYGVGLLADVDEGFEAFEGFFRGALRVSDPEGSSGCSDEAGETVGTALNPLTALEFELTGEYPLPVR